VFTDPTPSRRTVIAMTAIESRPASLRETAALFLRLGTTAFGGPAAHIALMEEEVVSRRQWLSREQFLDYLGATNLIPGPNSTELAIHLGLARHGLAGLALAGICFILPAAIIVTVIAWAYTRFGELPTVVAVFNGVTPAVLAVIAQALWKLGRSAVKSVTLGVLGALSVVAIAFGVNELVVLGIGGLIAGLLSTRAQFRPTLVAGGILIARSTVARAAAVVAATAGAVPFSFWTLFATFAKIGAVLFGSGYVLIAFLRADFVERLGWITERQLLDAVAVGQVTPGPLFTTATFVGYLVAGLPGAIVGTIGIFLPAFVFVGLSGPLVPRLRQSPFAGGVLDGVNVVSLALMAFVTWQLAARTLTTPTTAAIALVALVLLLRYRVNPTWLVVGGAVIGLALNFLGPRAG
jgi:chromate transporter